MWRVLFAVGICVFLASDVDAFTHGKFVQSGQNVVDDLGVLVVDDNGMQVVVP